MAGAWPLERGRTQAIAKYERQSADTGFTADGEVVAINPRQEENASIFIERGLSQGLTIQARGGLTRGHDRFERYEGRGPIELGLRYAVVRRPRTTASVYLGAADAGAGRNAGYAAPGRGGLDLEARLLLGQSITIARREAFADLQVARLHRPGLADETRLDATMGYRPARSWLVMAQAYAGDAHSRAVSSRWLKTEMTVVRSFGAWSVQAGWRQTVAGREVARDRGAVIGIWRTF